MDIELPESFRGSNSLWVNDHSMLSSWKRLPMFEAEPRKKPGNFAHCWDGGLIIDGLGYKTVGKLIENNCEFLPLKRFKAHTHYLMNILMRLDCLDMNKIEWRIGKKHGNRIGVNEYHFHAHLLTDCAIFTIPKVAGLFTMTRGIEPQYEFKTVVEQQALTGLKFDAIWSEGGPTIKAKQLVDRILG